MLLKPLHLLLIYTARSALTSTCRGNGPIETSTQPVNGNGNHGNTGNHGNADNPCTVEALVAGHFYFAVPGIVSRLTRDSCKKCITIVF